MATVSFVALTHHLKLMGLRPHYFKIHVLAKRTAFLFCLNFDKIINLFCLENIFDFVVYCIIRKDWKSI